MNNELDKKSPLPNKRAGIVGGILTLLLITAVATLAVSYTEQTTRTRIAANHADLAMRRIDEVLAETDYDNDPHINTALVRDEKRLGSKAELPVYFAKYGNLPSATVLTTVAPKGYVRPIRMLVGISAEGAVTGVRVTYHQETPGLGDQIEVSKSPWILSFDGKRIGDRTSALRLKRDGGSLDHISGATITSRAVTNAVVDALQYHTDNSDILQSLADQD